MKETFVKHSQGQKAVQQKLKQEFFQVPTYIYEGKQQGEEKTTAKNVFFTIIKNYQNKLSDLKEQILKQKHPDRYGRNTAFCANKLSRESTQRQARGERPAALNTSITMAGDDSQIMTNRNHAVSQSIDERIAPLSPRTSIHEAHSKISAYTGKGSVKNNASRLADSLSNKSTNVNSVTRKLTESSVQRRELDRSSLDEQIQKGKAVYDRALLKYDQVLNPAQIKFQNQEEELRQKIITITKKTYKSETDTGLKLLKSRSQNEGDFHKMQLFEKLNLNRVFGHNPTQQSEDEAPAFQILQLPRIKNSDTTRNLNNIYFAERFFKSKTQKGAGLHSKTNSSHAHI